MNRKLHNSFTALSISGALLVLGLIAATPLTGLPAAELAQTLSHQPAAPRPAAVRIDLDQLVVAPQAEARAVDKQASRADIESLADATALTAAALTPEIAAATALAVAFQQASAVQLDRAEQEPSRQTGKTARRHRQTLVMPYFSFAPRG